MHNYLGIMEIWNIIKYLFHSWSTNSMAWSWRRHYIRSYSCDCRLCFYKQAHFNGTFLFIVCILKLSLCKNKQPTLNYFYYDWNVIILYSVVASFTDGVIDDIYSYAWFWDCKGISLFCKMPKKIIVRTTCRSLPWRKGRFGKCRYREK